MEALHENPNVTVKDALNGIIDIIDIHFTLLPLNYNLIFIIIQVCYILVQTGK